MGERKPMEHSKERRMLLVQALTACNLFCSIKDKTDKSEIDTHPKLLVHVMVRIVVVVV